MKTSAEIRESYLSFFEGKDHLRLPSFSLIPKDDPTLLLMGAGMAPFKSYFMGVETPPRKRITTCQKCVRADDIELVGKTIRHHTFFEMLGNFSFGDYFKEETCLWAWEYFTDVLGLPADKLYISVHPDDKEAFLIWRDIIKIPVERIFFDEKNFWGPIGATGPCGPCSELLLDIGAEFGCNGPNCRPGCDCDRYLELWNLVFTGLNKNEKGEYEKLPAPCIDTGLGFERVSMVLQKTKSPYETDLFKPLIDRICEIAGIAPTDKANEAPVRIIADHIRAACFMIADQIVPTNDGRGYVLKRFIRRALAYGRTLKIGGFYLEKLSDPVINVMGGIYPELKFREEIIKKILSSEELNFNQTLKVGLPLLEGYIEKLKQDGKNMLPGKIAFLLSDTYGFPIELTREISLTNKFVVDDAGYEKEMEQQRDRAREAQKKKEAASMGLQIDIKIQTEFVGYRDFECDSEIADLFEENNRVDSAQNGASVVVLLNRTSFYPESGGQAGDRGLIISNDGLEIEIVDTQKHISNNILHNGIIRKGNARKGQKVKGIVDKKARLSTMRHHSATHLLHSALRQIIGEHTAQAGSFVGADYLRFDFSNFEALKSHELKKIEYLVNEKIMANLPVDTTEMEIDDARKSGAIALFDEKYGQLVRVVKISDFSKELCGGTHVNNTGQIGLMKIVSESAVGTGLRRIEAICGEKALFQLQELSETMGRLSLQLKTTQDKLYEKIEKIKEELSFKQKESDHLNSQLIHLRAVALANEVKSTNEIKYVTAFVRDVAPKDLRTLGDFLKEKIKVGVFCLGTTENDGANLLCMVTPGAAEKGYNAGEIIDKIAPIIDGKGGGKQFFAQAGGKKGNSLQAAILEAEKIILNKNKN